MHSENRIALSKVRMSHALECLRDAESNLASGQYKTSANRSYYAVFHAMRAVLALDGVDYKRHSGVLSEFQRRYVKNQIFPSEFSKLIRQLFEVRASSDYDDFYVISKQEMMQQVKNAAVILHAVEAYLSGI